MNARASRTLRYAPSELHLRLSRELAGHIRLVRLSSGTHLKEQTLADRFGVSRTPVRAALALLAENGLVERRANQGYFVTELAARADPAALDLPRSELDRLYAQVARDWLGNRVPERFTELDFRHRYGVGRPAASRVLLRLSEDGVIRREPGQGWRFEPTLDTREAHDESYRFRIVLEPAAIELETFRLDRALAADIRHRHEHALSPEDDGLPLSTLFELDAEFHRMIGRCARNRFFLNAIERQNALRRLVEYASLLDADRLAVSCAEHLGILDRLERDDRRGAAALMHDHLSSASRFGPPYRGRPVRGREPPDDERRLGGRRTPGQRKREKRA